MISVKGPRLSTGSWLQATGADQTQAAQAAIRRLHVRQKTMGEQSPRQVNTRGNSSVDNVT